MFKTARLWDLLLLLLCVSLASWWPQPEVVSTGEPVPRPERPHSPPVPPPFRPVSPEAVWLKVGLLLKLEQGSGPRLRLTLRNTTRVNAYIPGTFCRQGTEGDWWSHGVRVIVRNGRQQWRLGPSYGTRELHEHSACPCWIGPNQQLSWDFELGRLDQNCDGEGYQPGWDGTAKGRRLEVVCQMPQAGYTLVSNRLTM